MDLLNLLALKGLGGASAAQQPGTTDFAGQAAQIARRRKLAEALQQQALTPQQGQMVSGYYVAPGLAGALAQLVAGYRGNQLEQQADKDQSEFASRYRTGLGEEARAYTGNQNQNEAMISALTSQYPEMQELGKTALTMSGKNAITLKDLMDKVEPSSIPDLLAGKPPKWKSNKMGTVDIANPDGSWQMYQENPDGSPNMDKPIGSPFRKRATAGETVVNNAPVKGLTKYQEKLGEALAPGGEARKAAENAREGLTASAEAISQIDQGAKSGILQPGLQVVRKVLSEIPGAKFDETTPAETLSAMLKQATFKEIGGLGAQISDADREFVESFSGNLATDSAALKRILAIRTAAQLRRLDSYGRSVNTFSKTTDDPSVKEEAWVPFTIKIDDPEMQQMVENVLNGRPTVDGMQQNPSGPAAIPGTRSKPAPGGKPVMTLEDYLKAKGK